MGGGILAKVTQVRERRIGTELARDHVSGETALEVENVTELPAPSGELAVGFTRYAYTRDDAEDQDVDELDLEETPEPDDGTVTIDPPLAGDHEDGARVLVEPAVFERVAFFFLEEQEQELPARVDDSLYANVDRLPTGSRDDPEAAETVVVVREDDEYIVRDIVGEEGQSLDRGYVEVNSPLGISSIDPAAPDVVATLFLDIPSAAHRLTFWYFVEMDAPMGTAIALGFDDAGIDFNPGEFRLALYSPDATPTPEPHDALPLTPQSPEDTIYVQPDSAAFRLTAEIAAAPTNIMPYALDPPTPGLHAFRLASWLEGGAGPGSISVVRFWATVI